MFQTQILRCATRSSWRYTWGISSLKTRSVRIFHKLESRGCSPLCSGCKSKPSSYQESNCAANNDLQIVCHKYQHCALPYLYRVQHCMVQISLFQADLENGGSISSASHLQNTVEQCAEVVSKAYWASISLRCRFLTKLAWCFSSDTKTGWLGMSNTFCDEMKQSLLWSLLTKVCFGGYVTAHQVVGRSNEACMSCHRSPSIPADNQCCLHRISNSSNSFSEGVSCLSSLPRVLLRNRALNRSRL